ALLISSPRERGPRPHPRGEAPGQTEAAQAAAPRAWERAAAEPPMREPHPLAASAPAEAVRRPAEHPLRRARRGPGLRRRTGRPRWVLLRRRAHRLRRVRRPRLRFEPRRFAHAARDG